MRRESLSASRARVAISRPSSLPPGLRPWALRLAPAFGFRAQRLAPAPGFRRCVIDALNRPVDRLIARASAQIPGQPDLDFVERRIRPECDRREDHARRADAALRPDFVHERVLQRMVGAEPFYGSDLRAFDLAGGHEARAHRRAVDQHGARPALAFAAAFLRAGEATLLAQHVE